jgi:magnesium-transporting ATPase (P-type)
VATLHHTHTSDAFVCLKGAPERILKMCTYHKTAQGVQTLDSDYWLSRINEMAHQGQCVLAISVK